MAYEVDRLEIVIETATKKANLELDKLISKLDKVSSSLRDVARAATQINKANDAIKRSSEAAGKSSSAIKKMGEAYSKAALIMQLQATAEESAMRRKMAAIDILMSKYQGLNPAIKLLGNTMSGALQFPPDLVKVTEQINSTNESFERIRITMEHYDRAVTYTSEMLDRLRDATKNYETTMEGVTDVSKESKEKQLEIAEAYKLVTDAVNKAAQAKQVLSAIENNLGVGSGMSSLLGEDMNREIKQFNTEYSKSIATAKKLNQEMGKHKTEVSSTQSALLRLRRTMLNVISLVFVMRKAWTSVKRAMDFGETINLFQTVFRKIGLDAGKEFEFAFLNRAEVFSKTLAKSLALDPNDVMNYMANFAQMSNSMGLVEESSYRISESLTMLGADVASLFNIDVEQAMTRLRAGLSGQIRPMRMMGVDISKTTLSMIALEHGITDSLESMSAAAKVQLRYLAMTKQLEVTMGDMARTMDTPANQLRVMKQQFENTSRAIGQIFIPILTKIFPIVNGLIMALGSFFSMLAGVAGYKDPDYKDQDIVLGDIEEAAEDADEALQNLRHTMGGFDELNILSSGAISKDIIGDSGYAELDEAILKSNTQYAKVLQEQIDKMTHSAAVWQKRFETIIPVILRVTAVIVSLVAVMKIAGAISAMSAAHAVGGLGKLMTTVPIIGMVTKAVSGMGAAIGFLLSPVGLIVIAIAALVALLVALYVKNEAFRDSINGLLATFKPVIDSIMNLIFTVVDAIKPLAPTITSLFHSLGDALASVVNIISAILNVLFKLIAKLIDWLAIGLEVVLDVIVTIIDWVLKLINVIISVIKTVLDFLLELPSNIGTAFKLAGLAIVMFFKNTWETISNFFVDIWEGLKTGVSQFIEFFKKKFEDVKDFFIGIWETVSEFFVDIWEGLKTGVGEFIDFFKDKFEDIKDFFIGIWEPISNFFVDIWEDLKSGVSGFIDFFKEKFEGIIDSVMAPFRALKEMFSDLLSADSLGDVFKTLLNTLIKGLNAVISAPIDAINDVLNRIKSISILTVEPFTWIKTIPVPNIPQLAEGGIVGHGQMFIANEAGPEMVGQFGNKSGVINNEQIVEAVSRGVAQAVAGVMGSQTQGQGSQSVNVFLDGRQITNAVTQNKNRRGLEISRGGNR